MNLQLGLRVQRSASPLQAFVVQEFKDLGLGFRV